MNKTITCCPICGFELFPEAREVVDVESSFDICVCCFCEFGFDDTPEYRKAWIAAGHPFHEPEYKPMDWDPDQQLKKADYTWWNPISSGH